MHIVAINHLDDLYFVWAFTWIALCNNFVQLYFECTLLLVWPGFFTLILELYGSQSWSDTYSTVNVLIFDLTRFIIPFSDSGRTGSVISKLRKISLISLWARLVYFSTTLSLWKRKYYFVFLWDVLPLSSHKLSHFWIKSSFHLFLFFLLRLCLE
jgi:hypothetical protein